MPGTQTFCVATAGCNLRCTYCQNWEISQKKPEETKNFELPPATAFEQMIKRDCRSVTFTYTEPMVFYEYAVEVAAQARKRQFRAFACSGMYVKKDPLKKMCSTFDGFAGALKGFSEEFYKTVCGGKLAPVQEALVTVKEQKRWLEVVCLIIPTINDNLDTVKEMCKWIVKSLGKETPVHFARFVPSFKMPDLPRTPIKTLEQCREIALECGSQFSYVANLPGHEGNNTYCPGCKKPAIKRLGFKILENNIVRGKCSACQTPIAGLWA